MIVILTPLIMKTRTMKTLKILLVKNKKMKGILKKVSNNNNQPNNSKTLVIRAKVYHQLVMQTIIKSKIKVKKKVTLRIQEARR